MTKTSYSIAVLPGDGIGREVTAATLQVLHAGRYGAKCETCHATAAGGKLELDKDKGHALCVECHKKEAKGPAKCAECHKKA